MPGIDLVESSSPRPASVVVEAVADEPLRTSRLTLELDPCLGNGTRTNVSAHLELSPPIVVAGSVVNSITGEPLAGAGVHRNILFTTINGSSALTDGAGRFELRIPEALPLLWFVVYRDGFAAMTGATARRGYSSRDWAGTQGLRIRLRPMVEVSGVLRDDRGTPPEEPVEIWATFEDLTDPVWKWHGTDGEAKVGADGLFKGKLPAGRVTLALRGPPQQMGSMSGPGLPPETLHFQQDVEVPAAGLKGWKLTAIRGGKSR